MLGNRTGFIELMLEIAQVGTAAHSEVMDGFSLLLWVDGVWMLSGWCAAR
jgi:hypothetical protein